MTKLFLTCLIFLILECGCSSDRIEADNLNQIFVHLPLDTTIRNIEDYYQLFDTIFLKHDSFTEEANEYKVSSMTEENFEDKSINLLVRLDAKYQTKETENAQKQYFNFIERNDAKYKKKEDYKSHTNEGLIIGKAYYKNETEKNAFLYITLLKDTIYGNVLSFVYIRNIFMKE